MKRRGNCLPVARSSQHKGSRDECTAFISRLRIPEGWIVENISKSTPGIEGEPTYNSADIFYARERLN